MTQIPVSAISGSKNAALPLLASCLLTSEICELGNVPNLVDELIIYQSNNILGSNGVAWFTEDNAVENFGFKLESSYKIMTDTKNTYKNVKR